MSLTDRIRARVAELEAEDSRRDSVPPIASASARSHFREAQISTAEMRALVTEQRECDRRLREWRERMDRILGRRKR